MKNTNGTFLMASEPIPNLTPDDIRAWYASNHNETGLASAFASTNNEFWWVEDNVYDYEEGTEEYNKACDIKDAWKKLLDELLAEVFDTLRSQNVSIPDQGWNTVVAPFMEHNGYEDCGGWFILLKESNE